MTTVEFNEQNLSKEQIEQLENIVKESKKKKVWKPKSGDTVYVIDQFSEYEIDSYTFVNTKSSLLAYNIGLIFETREQTEFEIEKRKVEFEIKRYAESHNDEINWNDKTEGKYFIRFDFELKKIKVGNFWSIITQGTTYFTSEEDCKNCIEQVGENRIKKYIFGLEE